VIARIPTAVVFHPDNCAQCFPETAAQISENKAKAGVINKEGRVNQKRKKLNWIHKVWNKVKSRIVQLEQKKNLQFHHLDQDELWQPELTLYALEALRQGHPWSTWISQWQRDDPTYKLFCSNTKASDEGQIDATCSELKLSFAPYLDEMNIKAALLIKILRLQEERQVIPLKDDSETSSMYALLGSRAVALDDHLTGIIPFHDMINHSLDPNLSLAYTSDHYIDIYANREVQKGQELFLCYTKLNNSITSMNALWALVQWGIPIPEEELLK